MPILIAALIGAISATAFAPLDIWPLMPLAFAGLAALVERAAGLRRAAAIGWGFGFGQFAVGLNWIATAFTYQAAMPAWLGWVAVALLAIYLALFTGFGVAIAWRLARGRGAGALVLLLAAGWIVGEWLRAWLFTGFAWNPAGVIWIDLLPVARAARLIGTYGLSGIAVLAGGGLWLIARRRPLPGIALAAAPALAALAVLPLGDWAVPVRGPRIRIVQPNIGQDTKWEPGRESANFARLARLSGRPGPTPRLLLWPEAAVPDYLEQDETARLRIADLMGPRDAILLGGVSLIGDAAGLVVAAHNSLFALTSGGRLTGRYDKAHLVPYGEYLPMRPWLSAIGLSRLAPGDLDFEPGPGPRTLYVPGFGPIGIQICYEMIFSGHVVDEARRPRFLFNPSNDAWFGRWGPPQHLAQARLRAVEEGMPVVRSTPTGISAVVDADGRLLASLPWRTAGAIEVTAAAARRTLTPFARLGNLLPLLFALALGLGAIAVRRPTR